MFREVPEHQVPPADGPQTRSPCRWREAGKQDQALHPRRAFAAGARVKPPGRERFAICAQGCAKRPYIWNKNKADGPFDLFLLCSPQSIYCRNLLSPSRGHGRLNMLPPSLGGRAGSPRSGAGAELHLGRSFLKPAEVSALEFCSLANEDSLVL